MRTTLVVSLSIIPLVPEIAKAAGVDEVPFIASLIAGTAAIQRILLIPQIDQALTRFINAGAEPTKGDIVHERYDHDGSYR